MTHAQKRLKERYGINDTKGAVKKLTRMIKNNSVKSMHVKHRPGGASAFNVRAYGKDISVVFDWRRKQILTVLPKGVF